MAKLTCSFCGRPEDEVQILIRKTGSKICVCDYCAVEHLDILGRTEKFTEEERLAFQRKAFELRKLLYWIHPKS